jgi:transcriptional antiterminator RfaH
LGTFSYFSEYLGVEAPPQPLTFWSGDWDEFQKFDPEAQGWWCLYTHSRQEKLLMRHLFNRQLSFYCPLIEKRYRSPGGRMRSSFLPLFNNYVFLKGTDDDRRLALSTNCVLASKPVQQPDYFVHDLWQIGMVLQSGVAVTAEQKLEKGDPVMVKSGPFKGFEGFVQRRAGKTRFLIFLRYLEQGVSMEIDEGALVAM